MITILAQKYTIKLPMAKAIKLPMAKTAHMITFKVLDQCGDYVNDADVFAWIDGELTDIGNTGGTGQFTIENIFEYETETTFYAEKTAYISENYAIEITPLVENITVPITIEAGCEQPDYPFGWSDSFDFGSGGPDNSDIIAIFVTIYADGGFFTNIGVLLRDRGKAFGSQGDPPVPKLGFGQYTEELPANPANINPAAWLLNTGLTPLPFDIEPPDDGENFKSFDIGLSGTWYYSEETGYGDISVTYSNIKNFNGQNLPIRIDEYNFEDTYIEEFSFSSTIYAKDMPG